MTNQSPKEDLVRPGANVNFFLWLTVLGVPAFLLFLILAKHAPA